MNDEGVTVLVWFTHKASGVPWSVGFLFTERIGDDDSRSQHCANNDCMRGGLLRRELVAVSDFEAARINEERHMIRHARLSCPVDGFPVRIVLRE